jgi:hypothetical protein
MEECPKTGISLLAINYRVSLGTLEGTEVTLLHFKCHINHSSFYSAVKICVLRIE